MGTLHITSDIYAMILYNIVILKRTSNDLYAMIILGTNERLLSLYKENGNFLWVVIKKIQKSFGAVTKGHWGQR